MKKESGRRRGVRDLGEGGIGWSTMNAGGLSRRWMSGECTVGTSAHEEKRTSVSMHGSGGGREFVERTWKKRGQGEVASSKRRLQPTWDGLG